MIPKKERLIDARFYVAIIAMLAFFAKSLFAKPQQMAGEQLPKTFAGLEISPIAAFIVGLMFIALATWFIHVWKGWNGINEQSKP